MEKKILPYLVVLSALSVSLSAAFYSVTGLSKMFSGASIEVMIMMSSLEIAKLVLASLLYQYWGKLNLALKSYYFIAVFVLMSITSAGIYGYLSSAYSETSIKIENIDRKVAVLDIKRNMFQEQLEDIREEKRSTNDNISTLSNALSNNNIQFTNKDGQVINTTSSANRKTYEAQLEILRNDYSIIQSREIALSDSLTTIDLKKLELQNDVELSGEVGALKYISKLTGKTIDQVINWFIIALMLVFDPLAVSLVIGANVIFKDKGKKSSEKISDLDDSYKKLESKELQLKNKEEELLKNLKEKEKEISESNKKLNDELESRLNSFKENVRKLEEDRKSIESDKIELSQEKERLEEDRKSIESDKIELSQEKERLEEDRKSIESENINRNKKNIVYPKKFN
jgi:DNA repair exonuclease SbcCD ATPase subunit